MKNEELLKIAKKKYPPGTIIKGLGSNLICTVKTKLYIDDNQTITAGILESSFGVVKLRDEYNNWAVTLNPTFEMVEKRFPKGSKIINKYINDSFIMEGNVEIQKDSIYLETEIDTRYTLWDTKKGWATMLNDGKDIIKGQNQYVYKKGDLVKIAKRSEEEKDLWVNSFMDETIGKIGKINQISKSIHFSKPRMEVNFGRKSYWYFGTSLELVQTEIDKKLPIPNDYEISNLEHSNGIKSNTEHQIYIRIKPVKINYKPKSVKLSWEEQ